MGLLVSGSNSTYARKSVSLSTYNVQIFAKETYRGQKIYSCKPQKLGEELRVTRDMQSNEPQKRFDHVHKISQT